jgi:4-hydroxy-2-oxoheptanedioate aldolase
MADIPRLNGIIRALEQGKPAFTCFTQAEVENAVALSATKFDGIVFEMEHYPWDARALRDSLQYLLSRQQIAASGSVVPAVTPLVRIPPNGDEKNQWQAYNAVAACRYPRLKSAPLYEPAGARGDGPMTAARYWGLSQQDYYARADVWPLNPQGEILVILMIEDTVGIANLPDILKKVPGVGAVLIGQGDLSQELGYPRQYDHPVVVEHKHRIVKTCKEHNVVVGFPHADTDNIEKILAEGYRFVMAAPVRSFAALDKGRQLSGRT